MIRSLVKGLQTRACPRGRQNPAHLEAGTIPRIRCGIDSRRAGRVCKGRTRDAGSGDAGRDGEAARDRGPQRFPSARGVQYETRCKESSTAGARRRARSFSYGKDWWIFCTSITPDDGDWDAWKATLDEDYDHVSKIGQPAKFAQALARMVTEQIGPHGKDAWLTGTSEGAAGARTKHKSQLVIHGPVVYTDQLYETIVGEKDEVRKMAACLFAKPMTHAAQREYRFVVLNGGAEEETTLLKISGMMRDALTPTEGGLIRPSTVPAERVGEDGAPLPRLMKSSTTQRHKRATVEGAQGAKGGNAS